MNKMTKIKKHSKYKIKEASLGTVVVVLGIFIITSMVSAATTNTIQPASVYTIDDELQVMNNTSRFKSVYIGEQGAGGVTFFNGTIINNTTDDDGAGVPVTFGDDIRIDGRVFRGATAGTNVGDSKPFVINDNAEVLGTLTVADLLGTGVVSSNNIADGTITSADLANNAVTSAKIADGAVANSDIASNAVTSSKIYDGTIASGDIASSAVTGSKIASSAVTENKLGTGAVTSTKIYDGTITNTDVSSSAALSWSKLATGTSSRLLTTNGSGVVISATNLYFNGTDLGIGTTDPETSLEVDGVIKTSERTVAAAGTCNVDTEGGVYYDSGDSCFYGCTDASGSYAWEIFTTTSCGGGDI